MNAFLKAGAIALATFCANAAFAQETIRFAVTDIDGLEALQTEMGPFKEAFEAASGLKVEFFPVSGRTVAVEAMTFIAPVKVGDVLCIYTRVERIGTTSITIAMEAWARRNRLADRVKVTEGRFVYVALDEHGSKRRIEKT